MGLGRKGCESLLFNSTPTLVRGMAFLAFSGSHQQGHFLSLECQGKCLKGSLEANSTLLNNKHKQTENVLPSPLPSQVILKPADSWVLSPEATVEYSGPAESKPVPNSPPLSCTLPYIQSSHQIQPVFLKKPIFFNSSTAPILDKAPYHVTH